MARRTRRRSRQSKPKSKLPSIYNGKALMILLFGLLLGMSLFSFDPSFHDEIKGTNRGGEGLSLSSWFGKAKRCDNLIGPMGNNAAYGIFYFFGLGGFLIPVIMVGYALGRIVPGWDHMRRHLLTSMLFLLVICGISSLHDGLFDSIKPHLGQPYAAGGVIGGYVSSAFSVFGTLGGTIMLGLSWFLCIFLFTDRQLFQWLESWWDEKKEEEFEAYSSALKDKAKRVLEGYRRSISGSGSDEESGTADSAAVMAEEADAFSRQARGRKKKARQAAIAAVAAEPGNGTVNAGDDQDDSPDWGDFPEPTIRDMSQPHSAEASSRAGAGEGNPFDQEESSWEEESESMAAAQDSPKGDEIPSGRKPATARELLSLSRGNEPPPVSEEELEEARALEAEEAGLNSDDENEDGTEAPASVKPLYQPRSKAVPAGPVRVAAVPTIAGYKLPTITHLGMPEHNPKAVDSREELMRNALIMQTTLAQFKIEVKLGDITKGPTITRYELHPAPGIKMEKITSLTNNLAAALQAERINILAPIPGKSSVGIEVPNRIKSMVMMRELLESEQWRNSRARIPLALGKDVYGKPIVADLADMPHLLIAGATGSGKSVCINSVIASLLFKFKPDELRFVMIDPKVVELQQYNNLPHLVVPVVNDPKKVILALRWVINEMEKRYQIFAKVGVRNIHSFNNRKSKKAPPTNQPELPLDSEENADGCAVELDKEITVPRDEEIEIPDKLSYIVVIIDELADLMLVAPADVEMAIARITQMARAAGIHCIVATQRPSVDVITGVIKANIPCRIAFQVAAKVDSRTILDAMGADKLLGKGDMLYLPPGSAKLIRAQGALITDEEIQGIVDSINLQGKPTYEVEIHQQLAQKSGSVETGSASGIDEDEELVEKCIDVIRSEKKASVSLMQRRLRLGYTRAARIMDELENRGIVGPSRGAEPREILVDLDGSGADGNGSH
jgi:S-DNA-T family DNA segregation ATPase FtsK/SpoIIIE